MKILIDLDEVLADFVGGIHKRLGIPYSRDEWPYEWGPAGWDMSKWGIASMNEINDICDRWFWKRLPRTKDFTRIWQIIMEYSLPRDRYILTRPMENKESAAGKLDWIEHHLGKYYVSKTIITPVDKSFFAAPDRLLLDDCETNVESFRAAGGHAVLVPAPWNSNYKMMDLVDLTIKLQLLPCLGNREWKQQKEKLAEQLSLGL